MDKMATTGIHPSNSRNTFTFDNIINDKLIHDLLLTIADAQRSFRSTSLSPSDDDTAATNVADDEDSDESISNSNGGNIQNGSNSSKSRTLHLNGKLKKLRIDLTYIHESLTQVKKFEENVVTPFAIVSHRVKDVVNQVKNESLESLVSDTTFNSKLAELNNLLMDMKIHIPSSHKMYTPAANVGTQRPTSATAFRMYGNREPNVLDELPVLPSIDIYSRNPAFLELKEVYNSLRDFQYKLCLLCFSIFPENVIVRKRILIYWWIGEGLILPFVTDSKTADVVADEILTELVKKGFVEPVDQKYRPVANSFRMHPLIRSAVIVLSKEVGFFNFDDKGKPTTDFILSHRACLVGVGSSFKLTRTVDKAYNDEKKNNSSKSKGKISAKKEESSNNVQLNQEKLHTLYNVNEQYLKLVPEWFVKLKNVQVLQLGRWMNSAENHIEVEDVEFLKMLKNMKLLIYFSLQGISRISELPNSIGNLTNLRILDLRACHNLEKLPKDICSLRYLTHLDMSECYLLDSVPKEISLLSKLEVLKGFVVGDPHGGGNPCTLDDLKALLALRKLSISTGSKDFPTDGEVKAIQQFKALRNLKIIWGGNSLEKSIEAEANSQEDNSKKNYLRETPSVKKFEKSKTISRLFSKRDTGPVLETALPGHLEKVDLQCYPHTRRPSWLNPSHLCNLKNLYIRGGRLSDLCDKHIEWSVEILCLKHLYELTMDWTEMQRCFPKMKYLELIKCPGLTFIPCDDKGVWTK